MDLSTCFRWKKHQYSQVLTQADLHWSWRSNIVTNHTIAVSILANMFFLAPCSLRVLICFLSFGIWKLQIEWPKCLVMKQTAKKHAVHKSSSRCLRKRPKQPWPERLVQTLFPCFKHSSKPMSSKDPAFDAQVSSRQCTCRPSNYLVFAIKTEDIKCEPFNKVSPIVFPSVRGQNFPTCRNTSLAPTVAPFSRFGAEGWTLFYVQRIPRLKSSIRVSQQPEHIHPNLGSIINDGRCLPGIDGLSTPEANGKANNHGLSAVGRISAIPFFTLKHTQKNHTNTKHSGASSKWPLHFFMMTGQF